MKRSNIKNQISKTSLKIKVFNFKFGFDFCTLRFELAQLFLLLFFLVLIQPVNAVTTPNNKFGMSLAQPNTEQFSQVKELVNSNGGDWGYVTLIIEEKDRNIEKWQGIFDQLRQKHLIPIIRLATSAEGENWRRPEPSDAQGWADFLDSLNWVTKNRYIILFNEPNHGSEWGGEVDAKNYGEVAAEFAKKLKEKNKDYFIMLAGMDASAPSWMPGMEDEETFFREVFQQGQTLSASQYVRSDLVSFIDGLASHSYPNPGFSGSPYASGRGTVKGYEWELALLKELGVTKELPVFITETGWKRTVQNSEFIVQNYFQTAFDQIWGPDSRVQAVTPFVFDYQGEPFLEFSWKVPTSITILERPHQDGNFYQQYYTVREMLKIKGEPEQIEKGWTNFKLPTDLVVQSTYHFKVKINNLGQAVWDKDFGYQINQSSRSKLVKSVESVQFLFEDLKDIHPFEEKDIYFTLKTNDEIGTKKIKFVLQKNEKNILESTDWNINILPLPSLKFETSFFPWGSGRGEDFEMQIFDIDNQLVYKKKNISVIKGIGEVQNIQNIVLDELYRIVILEPYHLPRQEFVVFKKDDNKIKFKPLLPFDFNNDGAFNFRDILKFFKIK